MLRIAIPTIEDSKGAPEQLVHLYRSATQPTTDVVMDFTGCRFLSSSAVALLGGLCRLVQHEGHQVWIAGTKESEAYSFLKGTGFPTAGSPPTVAPRTTTSPFRQDIILDKNAIVGYLNKWLGQRVSVSNKLRQEIISNVWEIFGNSFEHSQSPVGVFSFGQFYPKMKLLRLTIVDFGVGIARNVKDFRKAPDMPSDDALKWAFEEGNTTRPKAISRGIGLELLRDFVSVNGGRLEIVTNDAHVVVADGEAVYSLLGAELGGTMAHITVRCDGRYYQLISEPNTGPVF